MVLPRIWVSCAIGEHAQQEMALRQRLISDLRTVGAEVVSDTAALSDEQFLPFLQRELASCQWFILVQTPQGVGSKRVQLAFQEALSCLKGGSLRGVRLINASSNGWNGPAPRPAMKSYAYDGDYPRLRDKLLLDLGLLQISGIVVETPGGTKMGRLSPVQKILGSQQQTAPGNAELGKVPSVSQLLSLFGSSRQAENVVWQHLQKTTSGDSPAPPRFSLPRPSRRFWLPSLVSVFSLVLIVSGVLLAKGTVPTPSPATVTFARPVTPTQPAPTCGPAVSDNFQGNIHPGWTWVNPTNQASYHVVTAGTLAITAPPNTDLSPNANDLAPRLLQPISGNFTLETQVEVPTSSTTPFWAAGLVIWQDPSNFLRVELNSEAFDFEQEWNGVFSHKAPDGLPSTFQAGLRIVRAGNMFSAYYLLSGQSWQLINTASVPFRNVQAGLILVNITGAQFTAYYHSFHVICNEK